MFVLPLPVWLMLILKQAINHINKLQALYEKFTLDNHNYLDKNRMALLQIDAEAKPLTNQKSSGRCWLFAALNVIRLPVIKHFNLEDFEFSQGYLFYWDKIERCNFFLHNIVETAKRNEPVDSRLVSFLLYVSCWA